MNRSLLCSLLWLMLPLFVMSQDRITFIDRSSKTGSTLLRSGTILSEDPGKVSISSGETRRSDIAVSDIIDISYDGEPVAEMNAARAAERDRKADVALATYQEAQKKVTADKKLLRRHLEFKVAELRSAQAEAGVNPAAAMEAMRTFVRTHPDGRQSLAALDSLGRLLVLSRQPLSEVLDALAQLRVKHGADNKDVASRCDLLRSDIILQDLEQAALKEGLAAVKERAMAASKSIADIVTIADRTIQADLVARQTYCQALVQAAPALAAWDAQLRATEEPRSRAAIHLARGDYYKLTQKYQEAMWDYLWVDTVYFADRQQQAKALYCLIEVFDKLGDDAKSRDCKERLQQDGRLRDSRYQKLVTSR